MKRQLELFSKVGSAKKKAVKAKVGNPVYNAYKKAPLAVKKIIDTLDSEESYTNLNNAAKKLKKLGWDMDFSLDGSITKLTKMKKTSKKVGAKAKAKKSPARSMHKDTKSHNVNIRVMSGFNDQHLKDLNKWVGILREKENRLKIHQNLLSRYTKQKDKESIIDHKKIIKVLKLQIKLAKKHITIIKRQIK